MHEAPAEAAVVQVAPNWVFSKIPKSIVAPPAAPASEPVQPATVRQFVHQISFALLLAAITGAACVPPRLVVPNFQVPPSAMEIAAVCWLTPTMSPMLMKSGLENVPVFPSTT